MLSFKIISLDRFFKPVEQMPKYYSSLHQDYRPDFNTPESLFVDEMIVFCRQQFNKDVIIYDGHFALYFSDMRALMDIKCYVDTSIEEMLERRTRRNLSVGYGGSKEEIRFYNQECVLPGYYQYIQPTRKFADIIISNERSKKDLIDTQLTTIINWIEKLISGNPRN